MHATPGIVSGHLHEDGWWQRRGRHIQLGIRILPRHHRLPRHGLHVCKLEFSLLCLLCQGFPKRYLMPP